MAVPRSASAASTLGLSRWRLIFNGAVMRDWMSAIPMLWNWLIMCSDYQLGDGGITALAGFISGSWRYRPAASARRASSAPSPSGAHTPSGQGASGISPRTGRLAGSLRYHPNIQHSHQHEYAHIWLAGRSLKIVFGACSDLNRRIPRQIHHASLFLNRVFF